MDCRQLHDALLSYEGQSAYVDVLLPWLDESQEVRTWLRSFGSREGDPIPPVTVDELWALYGLSRVCDLLILRFQDGGLDSDWPGPPLSTNEFVAFIEALGLTVSTPTDFCEFYHEVVKVDPMESDGVRIVAYKWPCVMLGNLLVVRGGVEVAANASVLRPGVADASTLYWTYRRKARPCADLSHGWGSNSQWRTKFRRDYVIGDDFYFNVDGKRDLGNWESQPADPLAPNAGLTLEQRIELLKNRCFVRTITQEADLWPYDDRLRTTRSGAKIKR